MGRQDSWELVSCMDTSLVAWVPALRSSMCSAPDTPPAPHPCPCSHPVPCLQLAEGALGFHTPLCSPLCLIPDTCRFQLLGVLPDWTVVSILCLPLSSESSPSPQAEPIPPLLSEVCVSTLNPGVYTWFRPFLPEFLDGLCPLCPQAP